MPSPLQPQPESPQDIDAPPPDCDPQQPTPQLLLWAYRNAIFPMGDPDSGKIEWFSPDPRGIIPLQPAEAFHVPGNLAREVRKKHFDIRCDTVFERVMRACDIDRDEDNRSWLNARLIQAYTELHRIGHAHSVEAWLNGELVGGLYGVHIGGAFFGESMFNRPGKGGSNSSKVCLVHLVRHLQARGFSLLDTQFRNPHLDQFGCIEIPAKLYEGLLAQAIKGPVSWGALEPLAA